MKSRNYYIFLVYKGISKKINTPKNFDELKKSFFKEFNEDKNRLFNFSYLTSKNKNIDFIQLKKKRYQSNNKPIIYVESSKNFSNPQKIKLLSTLTTDAFNSYGMNNTFCIFKYHFNTIILLYAKKNTIISYNIVNNQKINEYKNAHCNNIINFKHYYDKKNNRHLIMSISEEDNNLKIWNYSNFKCLCNIVKIMSGGDVLSACFLNYKNNILFIVDNFYVTYASIPEPIKVYNWEGSLIKEIEDSNSDTYFIDTYYDSKKSKYFIITTNPGYIKSYDYEENKTYYNYSDNDIWGHRSAVICETYKSVKIIESSDNGNIRVWNFHSGKLIKKIKVSNKPLYSICLWSNEDIFVSCEDKTIRLINLITGKKKIIICDKNINNIIMTLKKYYIPIYGECLISQGKENEQIKIFNNRRI